MPRRAPRSLAVALLAAAAVAPPAVLAQTRPSPRAAAAASTAAQPNDSAYTARIREYLQDPRITTELVDHLPASNTVPTPLRFLGRIVGTPGELTHARDIHRYLEALAKAAPARTRFYTIGKTEEGRDMVLLAIADEATIRQLDRYRGMVNALTDPRTTSDAEAQRLIHAAKPVYYVTSGIHSPEFGGPEMLMELAYRLVVEETPFIQNIRNNVITLITPVVEVDGREKAVDTYYFNKANKGKMAPLPLMYWGKYVQHDNNRDGMGQFLALTQNITKTVLSWTPTVMHDLHEAQTYLYASTGTGPYNDAIDPMTIDAWWILAKNDVLEMTKRGVPGVWTYGFYDGWVPNYLFFIAHTHNAIGRFYEVQSYGPDNYEVRPPATTTSREWFRPNPPLPYIRWGARNNTNIQESALLFSLSHVARNRDEYLENYWLTNKRAVARGTAGPIAAWVLPAQQHAPENVVEAVNDLRRQGLEVHRAAADFRAGDVDVRAGDFVIRGDQPYRTIADMYFSLQNFSPANPSPYDDTGWTFPLMRNITVRTVGDRGVLAQKMELVRSDVVAPGGILGAGRTLVLDATGDNTVVTFRFKFANVAMRAAEQPFDAAGRHFAAGAIIVPDADRARLEPALRSLGLTAYGVADAPTVRTHDLDVPRIGYVHSWTRTQDEGWVRAALDHYGVPYTYFGEPRLREGNLRAKFDVIVYPHGGTGLGGGPGAFGGFGGGGAGGGARGADTATPPPNVPVPYRRTAEYQSLGFPDSTDDVRGGVGPEGMRALYEFVRQGGTLVTEGSTSAILPDLGLTPGVTVENPPSLFARGTILRGVVADRTSPLVYGYDRAELPVYFSAGPVLAVGAVAAPAQMAGATAAAPSTNAAAGPSPAPASDAAAAPPRDGRNAARVNGQNITPMATPLHLSPWDPDHTGRGYGMLADSADAGAARGRGGRGGAGGGGAAPDLNASSRSVPGLTADPSASTRVVLQFPARAEDMLLSGTLEGGATLANRAQLVDESIGKGHVVLFAIRPFWRWQTQGTFGLGFNALLHWNDLGAR